MKRSIRISILALLLLPLTIQCQNATKSSASEEVPVISEVPDHMNYSLLTQRISELAELFEEDAISRQDKREEYRMYFEYGWTPPALIKVLVQGDSSELTYKYYHPDDFRKDTIPDFKIITTPFTKELESFRTEFEKLGFWQLAEVDTPSFTVLDNDMFFIDAVANRQNKLIGRLDSMERRVEDFRRYLFELVESREE